MARAGTGAAEEGPEETDPIRRRRDGLPLPLVPNLRPDPMVPGFLDRLRPSRLGSAPVNFRAATLSPGEGHLLRDREILRRAKHPHDHDILVLSANPGVLALTTLNHESHLHIRTDRAKIGLDYLQVDSTQVAAHEGKLNDL